MDNNIENSQPGPKKKFYRSRRFWKPVLGVMIGATAGFMYYYFIGCKTGSCPITSNPFNSVAIGGVFGFLLLTGK